MSTRKRRKVIAGNWKMNMTPSETKDFVAALYNEVKGKRGCDIVICVPAIDIPAAVKAAAGKNIKVGGQNVHFAKSGAYAIKSGDLALKTVAEIGVINPAPYGFAVKKGTNAELIDRFNKGLANIKANGKYDEILAKYGM